MEAFDVNTDLSLIERMVDSRLRNHAWNDFVKRYNRLFFHWFRHWDVNPSDMEDVLQETLVKILGNVRYFERRRHGSFRLWLRTLALNCWHDLTTNAERQLGHRHADNRRTENWQRLRSKLAQNSLLEMFDAWATEELLNMAESRVRRRVEPETWSSYFKFVHENIPVETISLEFSVDTERIYSRVFRVRRMIREVLDRIEAE